MARIYIFIFCTIGFFQNVSAQTDRLSNLIRANELYETGQLNKCISICKTCLESSNSAAEKYKPAQSYQLGMQAGYHFSQHFSAHLGLIYSAREYNIHYAFANWDIHVNEKLKYLDIPLSFRYSPLSMRKCRPYIEAGVFGGYIIRSENDFKRVWTSTGETSTSVNVNSRTRRNLFAYGVQGGVGVSYKTNQGHFFLSGNYSYSMQNITKISTRYNIKNYIYNYYYLDDDIRLNSIAISIGYTLYLNYKVLNK